jgi:hypothetical protein
MNNTNTNNVSAKQTTRGPAYFSKAAKAARLSEKRSDAMVRRHGNAGNSSVRNNKS